MNVSHSRVTDWGLSHIVVKPADAVLDIGCGGGRTIGKLSTMASQGKIYGVDHSPDSVAHSRKANRQEIDAGKVTIVEGSVSHLPVEANFFDLATGIETHFFWPNLAGDMREVLRVLKRGGKLLIVAEVYRGAQATASKMMEKYASKMGLKFMTESEHREMFEEAGFAAVQVFTDSAKGWICAVGTKPSL